MLLLVVFTVSLFVGDDSNNVINYITFFSSFTFYVLHVIVLKLSGAKITPVLIGLFILTECYVVVSTFTDYRFMGVFGSVVICSFILYSKYTISKKADYILLGIMSLNIGLNVISEYYSNFVINIAIILTLVAVILRFIDPILTSIALEHKRKRLELEESNCSNS